MIRKIEIVLGSLLLIASIKLETASAWLPPPPRPAAGTPIDFSDSSCVGVTMGGWTEDSQGWTVIPKALPLGGREIYVSAKQTGTDNLALQKYYVKTWADGAKLLRKNYPDQIYLNRGETFPLLMSSSLSGKSVQAPMVVAAYGTGERPVIQGGVYLSGSTSNLILQSLDLQGSHGPTEVGLSIQGAVGVSSALPGNVLVEDVRIQNFSNGITWNPGVSGSGVIATQNLTLRRSQMLDNQTSGKSQGVYVENVRGLLLEDNVVDHNGNSDIFSHNMYLQAENECLIVRNNISSRAGSHGLQQRAGGVMQNNFFVRDPIGASWGLVNGGSVQLKHLKPGVTGQILNNVVYESTDISAATPRGYGFQIGNAKALQIQNNLLSGYVPLQPKNYSVAYDFDASMGIGIHNGVTLADPAFGYAVLQAKAGLGWGAVIVLSDGTVTDTGGKVLITSTNSGLRPLPGKISILDSGVDLSGITKLTTAPALTLATYLGNPKLTSQQAFDQFITAARAQSRMNWNSKWTGLAVSQYFLGGSK